MMWLSFVDPDKPKGKRFLGVAIVPDALEVVAGAKEAWRLKCNPGGEVSGTLIGANVASRIPIRYVGRLLTRYEALELQRELKALEIS